MRSIANHASLEQPVPAGSQLLRRRWRIHDRHHRSTAAEGGCGGAHVVCVATCACSALDITIAVLYI